MSGLFGPEIVSGPSLPPLLPSHLKFKISPSSLGKLKSNLCIDQSVNIHGVTSLGQNLCQSTVLCHPREHILHVVDTQVKTGTVHLRAAGDRVPVQGGEGPLLSLRV